MLRQSVVWPRRSRCTPVGAGAACIFDAQVHDRRRSEAVAPKVSGDDDQTSSMGTGPACEALFVTSLATRSLAGAGLLEWIRTIPSRSQNLVVQFSGVRVCLWTSGMLKTWLFDNELFQGQIE